MRYIVLLLVTAICGIGISQCNDWTEPASQISDNNARSPSRSGDEDGKSMTSKIFVEAKAAVKCQEVLRLSEDQFNSSHTFAENQGLLVTKRAKFFSTKDGGKTWSRSKLSIQKSESVMDSSYLALSTGWVLVGSANERQLDGKRSLQKIYRTMNGGKSWEKRELSPNYFVQRIRFQNEKIGWLFGQEYNLSEGSIPKRVVLWTTDGGFTWSRLIPQSDFFEDDLINDAIVAGDAIVYGVTSHKRIVYFAINPDDARVLATVDLPQYMSASAIGRVSNYNSIWIAAGANNRHGVGGVFAIFRDDVWSYFESSSQIVDAVVVAENEFILVGYAAVGEGNAGDLVTRVNPQIIISKDAGRTWGSVCEESLNGSTIVDLKPSTGDHSTNVWCILSDRLIVFNIN